MEEIKEGNTVREGLGLLLLFCMKSHWRDCKNDHRFSSYHPEVEVLSLS